MPKQIIASNPQTTAVYRFIGRRIYLKVNNEQYAAQLLTQIQAKGGSFVKKGNWLELDIFGNHEEAKLGNITFNMNTATDDMVEEELVSFFHSTLEAAKFKCELSDI